ncbi:MAG TPA: GNAT family N-acetyltransferase [Acidimicrobiales bacterium]|nr:GNAT family N-acetyltransferase [Acidimicrobiales bacterium]
MPALRPPSPALSDGSIALRPFEAADVPAVTRACQDPEIPRWTAAIPSPYTEADAEHWIATHPASWARGTGAAFAVVDVDTGDLVGSVGLQEFDWATGEVIAGYWVAAWARNRGVATRALQLAVGWAFDDLGIVAVELATKIGNTASERVAEKGGFFLVGIDDDHEVPAAPGRTYRVKLWRREAV